MHPYHASTPVVFEPPVKSTASALSSPFMSISIANTKTASISTTLAVEKSSKNPALDGKSAVPRRDMDVPLSRHTPSSKEPLRKDTKYCIDKHNIEESSPEEIIPAPSYESSVGNIPALDPLPPPPVYDIVNCSTTQTLLLVSSLINTILTVNDRLRCPKITLFHSRAIPNISIEAYLTRILQYAPFQNEVLLIILLYFDRIGGGCKPTQVLTNNIPKSLLIKAFGTDKNPFSNQSYGSALVSPISTYSPEKTRVGTSALVSEGDSRLMDELMKDGGAEMDKESAKATVIKQAKELEAKHQHNRRSKPLMPGSKLGPGSDVPEEEEPIEDEIYTSSAESPIGSKLIINSFNIHRLLITSILVASKFSSDVFYPNARYARVGGLPLSELNQLELEFLFLSQFELNATETELQAYGNKLLMYQQRLASEKKLPSLDPDVAKQTPTSPPPPRFPNTLPSDRKEKPVPEPLVTRQSMEDAPPATDSSTKDPPVVHAPVPTRPAPIRGSYRDSKEGIRPDYDDEDDTMSQKDEPLLSPTESEADASILKNPALAVESTAPRSYSRHNVMNLDSLVWPTNKMEDYRPSTNYFFGGMVKDEDAERIEQEFNRPSPPPEEQEHQKRKLQRLSGGSIEAKPSKRTNPSSDKRSSKEGRSSTSSSSSSGNILKPFFRKIASLAHRSEPQGSEQPEPEPPSLRTHPYLVRPRVSPPSPAFPEPPSADRTKDGAEVPSWPTTSNTTSYDQGSSWSRHRAAPPPYTGKTSLYGVNTPEAMGSKSSIQSRNRATREYRRHRSREPSISTLASELTFEPRQSSLSPSAEDEMEPQSKEHHPATLAPLSFPSRPQTIDNVRQTHFSQPTNVITEDVDEDMPMAEREDTPPKARHDHDSNNANSMQIDGQASKLASRAISKTDKDNFAAAVATTTKMHPPAPATPVKSRPSSRRSSVCSNAASVKEQASSTAGRQWNSSHAPAPTPTTSTPSPFPGVVDPAGRPPSKAPQVYHPHHPPYVASYYAPPPNNFQLYHDPATMKTYPIMTHPHQSVLLAMPPMPAVPLAPASASAHPAPAAAPSSQARPSKTIRQFASIRPRTPTVIAAQAQAAQKAAAATTSTQPPSSSGDKSDPTAKSSKKSLFGSSKKTTARAAAPPPPPSHAPPTLPFIAAGPPPIVAFAHAAPPHALAQASPHGTAAGAPILIPLIPVMYNNVRPHPPPPTPTPTPHPPALVKIAPKLPQT
ncbi:hypothetical protein BGW42_003942 [Actinomortierella wolfii]|nr:hypothetical protein BGW42_003942 [Actinomortierella wolfii]